MPQTACEVVYDYIEEIDPNLTCAICQSALVDPVTTTSCKHTFCRDCITTALSHSPQCPIDRSALTRSNLQDTETLVKLMLDELKVKCGAEGCEKVMERGLLLSHSRGCGGVKVMCKDGDCGLMMRRETLSYHRVYECFQRRMECGRCKVVLTFKHREEHPHAEDDDGKGSSPCDHCGRHFISSDTDKRVHKWTCSKAPVACPHTTRGCSTICPREDLDGHIKSCPFEALSTFFELNDSRLAKLEEKNIAMSRTIDILNAEVGVLKADLSSTKESLAHIRRIARESLMRQSNCLPDGSRAMPVPTQGEPVTPRSSTDDLPSETEIATPRGSTSQESTSSPTSAPLDLDLNEIPRDMAQGSTMGSAQFRSGGTPSESPRIARERRPDLLLGSATPLDGPNRSMSFADEVFERLPVGTTTEEALETVMAILVRLGSGLDGVDRRAHLRTMTEVLRTREEVASLRAIVNTLRMQVMIDRPRSFRRPMPIPTFQDPENVTGDIQLDPPIHHQPFSSYSAGHSGSTSSSVNRDTSETEGSDGENDSSRPRLRESVLFQQSVNRSSISSTSSLVSTGGRTIGRPMGIPPPLPTDFSRVAAMSRSPPPSRPRNPIVALGSLGRRFTQRDREPGSRL